MSIKTSDLEQMLQHASKDSLNEIEQLIESVEFVSELERLLELRQMSKSDIIKNTLLERSYAYQIMAGTKRGSKDKILQICLALNCDLEETNRLLTLSENPKLYAKDKRDLYLIYAINHKYSVMMTNELLEENQHLILS